MATSRRMRGRRIAVIAATCIVLIGGVVAALAIPRASTPSPSPSHTAAAGPRALTIDEAERLAVARFLAYQVGSVRFDTAVETGDGKMYLDGRVDHRAAVGIASAEMDGASAIITWNESTFVGWNGASSGSDVPSAPPPQPGGARPLDPTASSIDTVLLLVLSLGADRPENAQLLAQSDAAWLRADEIDDVTVDVFSGPSSADSAERDGGNTRFWIDAEGALLRFEAELPSQTVTVDLKTEKYVAVPASPQLAR